MFIKDFNESARVRNDNLLGLNNSMRRITARHRPFPRLAAKKTAADTVVAWRIIAAEYILKQSDRQIMMRGPIHDFLRGFARPLNHECRPQLCPRKSTAVTNITELVVIEFIAVITGDNNDRVVR